MSDKDDLKIDELKAQIAATHRSLESKVRILESNVKETALTIKDTVEQGAANVRNVANVFTPAYHVEQHPLLFVGVMFGAGLFLGGRMSAGPTRFRIRDSSTKNSVGTSPVAPTQAVTAGSSIAQSVALGIFAALAGEVVKKYVPKVETQASSIQSAVISEMTQRVVRRLK